MYGNATGTLAATGAAGLSLFDLQFGLVQLLVVGVAAVALSVSGYRLATAGKRHDAS